jgi:hypothetical protein
MYRKLSAVAAAMAVTGGLVLAVAPSASATRGPCTGTRVTAGPYQGYSGWCDGNGPDSYHAWARCFVLNSHTYYDRYGPTKWDGDRTKSTAWCDAYDEEVAGAIQ